MTQRHDVSRRQAIAALTGAAIGLSSASGLAQTARRRIAALMNLSPGDAESQARLGAFIDELRKLGWASDANIQLDVVWGEGKPARFRQLATELATAAPDVLVGASGPVLVELLGATRTIPIVFAQVIDPVGAGYVQSLNRPGGNATGFTLFDFSMSAKWLEFLVEMAPRTRRVAILYDAGITAGGGQVSVIEAAASRMGLEFTAIDVRDLDGAGRALRDFANTQRGTGGLIVTGSPLTGIHRKAIASLALETRLPAVYPFRINVADGGLMSYGPDLLDSYRRAAHYVDRILRGAKPADLPVQNPVKFDLHLNLATARAIGLTFPPSLLARADEVIE